MISDPTHALRLHNVGQLIRRSARREPKKDALVYQGRTTTYEELLELSLKTASALRLAGVSPGDRVAVMGRNSDTYVIGWLGCVYAGVVHVPLNFSLMTSEIEYILVHSGAVLALVDSDLYGIVASAVSHSPSLSTRLLILEKEEEGQKADHSSLRELCQELDVSELEAIDQQVSAEATAQIAYTSGTESRPKGCMLSHAGLLAEYSSCILAGDYESSDCVLNSMPLYHCAQMHCFLMPALYVGSTNIITRDAEPITMRNAIRDYGVSSVFAPPTVWGQLLRHPDVKSEDFSSVLKGYYGASIMPVRLLEELAETFPRLHLWNYYGQTELGPLATALQPEDQLMRAGAAGKPVLNVETRVVDEGMRDVDPGAVGEIVHRSPQLMCGYYGDEKATAAAIEGGWFHSGDLGSFDRDGYLSIVDRKKDIINTGGENVSSREVEEVLYCCPGIAEVAVVGVLDPVWIEAVYAVVVRKRGAVLSESDVIEFAKRRMAGFKAPKGVRFVAELPKNPSGKILKRDLRKELEK